MIIFLLTQALGFALAGIAFTLHQGDIAFALSFAVMLPLVLAECIKHYNQNDKGGQ